MAIVTIPPPTERRGQHTICFPQSWAGPLKLEAERQGLTVANLVKRLVGAALELPLEEIRWRGRKSRAFLRESQKRETSTLG
jgi:hypothetical protein